MGLAGWLPALFVLALAGCSSPPPVETAVFAGPLKTHKAASELSGTPVLGGPPPAAPGALAAPPLAPPAVDPPPGEVPSAAELPPGEMPPAAPPVGELPVGELPAGEPIPAASPLGEVAPDAPPIGEPPLGNDAVDVALPLPPPPAPPAGPPRYSVIAQRANDRPDKMVTYYVEIDPIDPNVDAFKPTVKEILATLAANNGGPMFSAQIWDNLPAAQTEVSFVNNPDIFSEQLLEARKNYNDQHLIASYVGGLSSPGGALTYDLLWFPMTDPQTPAVGQWVSAEVWKP